MWILERLLSTPKGQVLTSWFELLLVKAPETFRCSKGPQKVLLVVSEQGYKIKSTSNKEEAHKDTLIGAVNPT